MLPHFAYMSMRLLPTKTSSSYPFWTICSWTHLPSSIATTLTHAPSTARKVLGTGCMPSCCICQKRSNALCPCPHFTYPRMTTFQETTLHVGILWNTLQASSILPHLANISTRLLPTQTFDSQPLWVTCLCTRLPSSCACEFAHALSTWTKVRLSGGMPSCCICWKSCLIFSYCPVLAYLASLAFQWKMLNCKVHGAIAANSASTHGGFNLSLSHRASAVSLCLKSG